MDPNLDVQCCEVIIHRNVSRGSGVDGDPARRIIQVWTKSGELIAEYDEWATHNKNQRNEH